MRHSLEEWKNELVGNIYGWLTVIDVIIDDDNKMKCICRCKCGNIKKVFPCHISKMKVISCGCYIGSKEQHDNRVQFYKDNPDVIAKVSEQRKKYYNIHPEAREKASITAKQWCKNNPDKVKEQAEKCKQYYIDNPEKAKEIGIHKSEWCKNNPDKVKEQAEKCKEWCKNNPDKIKERVEKYKQWCKDNPEKLINAGNKVSEWYKNNTSKVLEKAKQFSEWCKNNPDKVKEKSEKYKQWCKDNPDKIKEITEKRIKTIKNNPEIQKAINDKRSEWYKNNQDAVDKISKKISEAYKIKRANISFQQLLLIIHPDHINDLLNGNLSSTSKILTKCPLCGEYDWHSLHNVFRISYNDLKSDDGRLCTKCTNAISKSKYEDSIFNIISSFYNGECIRNSREIIQPYELDLYYPEKKIAIEFNGNYWHGENHKSNNYHFNKFKLCKEKGIRLISIFESDWINNHDKVILILKNSFCNKQLIYARKCIIKQLDYNTKSEFINKYHFDGDSTQGNIAYGLYYNDELISAMTFGKLRGQNKAHSNINSYELVRFVTKDNISIIGGASKLFKYFIKCYSPKYILCYSDNDLFTGDVYNNLGFTLKSLGEKSIDYQWINGIKYKSRYECMPKKLLNKYPEYKNVSINGSVESYIMHDLGYNKLYRCGNSIWEYKL